MRIFSCKRMILGTYSIIRDWFMMVIQRLVLLRIRSIITISSFKPPEALSHICQPTNDTDKHNFYQLNANISQSDHLSFS